MRATLTLALLLLWLALTGGYAGWQQPTLLLVNVAGWIGLMVWLAWSIVKARFQILSFREPGYYLLLFVCALVSSTLSTGAWQHGVIKIGVWLAYLAFYYLGRQWDDSTIHRAAGLALIPYILFSFFDVENPNVVAFNLLGLALLAMPGFNWFVFGPVVLIVGGLLGCVAGVLSALVAATRYAARPVILYLGFVPLGLLGWWINPAGYAWRLEYWADAWRGFLSAPIAGLGPGMYYTLNDWPHAHNIIATTAAEGGLIGLAALVLLVGIIARRWSALPVWAAAVVLAFGAWSMVDEPLHTWGPGFIFFIALSRREEYDFSTM